MINQLSYLALAFRDFMGPLNRSFSSPEALEYLCSRYGWKVLLDEAVFSKIYQLSGIKTSLEDFLQQAKVLQESMDAAEGMPPDPQKMISFARSAQKLLKAIADIKLPDLTTLPEPLNQGAFWTSIREHVLDDLLEKYLHTYHSNAYLFLHLFGVIRYEPSKEAGTYRIPYTRTIVDWGQALAILKNPLSAFKQTYHWNDAQKAFDHQRLLSSLEKALQAIGLSARLMAPDMKRLAGIPTSSPYNIKREADALNVTFLLGLSQKDFKVYEAGLSILPLVKTGQAIPSGLLINPVLRGGAGIDLKLNDRFKLRLKGAVDAVNPISVALFGDKLSLTTGAGTINSSLEIVSTNTTPWYLLGNANTTRLELSGVSIQLSLEGTPTDPEIKLHLKSGDAGCKAVILLDEADGLVKQAAKTDKIEFSFGVEIIWSSKTGLHFNGAAGLEVQLPITKRIGPVLFQNFSLALKEGQKKTSTSGIALEMRAGMKGNFGPLAFVIEKMGFSCTATPYNRQDVVNLPEGSKAPLLGNLDLDLNFAPPKGIGIQIDAKGVTGSGYLEFNPEKGEYTGVVQLNFRNKVNFKAFGIIQTHLPGGAPAFSFLVIVSAEFTGIQLGLGFSLTGVGGLIGIHRRVELQKLKDGIYEDNIDDILFPKDPLKNAQALIGKVNQFFPPAENQYTFGLMGQLTWGPKKLVTIEMGLIMEFPEPVRMVVLGVLRSEVTRKIFGKERTALKLQINFLAAIDFDRKFIRVDAALVNSSLLGMKLEGDLALRINYGNNPEFAISVGGFHPDFQPPSSLELPSKMRRLQIILRSGNPSITVKCYMAVTSNTIQFGAAGLFVYKKWSVKIRGELAFDALFQLSPFRFSVSVHFLLAASWRGHDFASIEINGTFSGPSPWHIKGKFKLKMWIFKISVPIDISWGERDDMGLERVRVLPILAEDLRNIANWERVAGSYNLAVTIKKDPRNIAATAYLMMHPTDLLTVRQNVVPLGQKIELFAGKVPKQSDTFNLSLKKPDNTSFPGEQPVEGYFARAQFFKLTDEEKLYAKSYERYKSGLTFNAFDTAASDPVQNAFAKVDAGYETRNLDGPPDNIGPGLPPPGGSSLKRSIGFYQETDRQFAHSLSNNAVANAAFNKLTNKKKITGALGERYVIVDGDTLSPKDIAPLGSEAEAWQLLRQMKENDVFGRLNLTVLPMGEVFN